MAQEQGRREKEMRRGRTCARVLTRVPLALPRATRYRRRCKSWACAALGVATSPEPKIRVHTLRVATPCVCVCVCVFVCWYVLLCGTARSYHSISHVRTFDAGRKNNTLQLPPPLPLSSTSPVTPRTSHHLLHPHSPLPSLFLFREMAARLRQTVAERTRRVRLPSLLHRVMAVWHCHVHDVATARHGAGMGGSVQALLS
jgi:hypothetical protein